MKRSSCSIRDVVAVSGGPDSVYLVCTTFKKSKSPILVHLNHGTRGRESDKDQALVERLGREKGIPVEVRKVAMSGRSVGFEKNAREARYKLMFEMKKRHQADRILVGHTADDQVETVLMRILEGAGITGLKGIPRKTDDGIERPILDTWREDILEYLHKHKVPFRVDRSNLDIRFERNWIRQVLIPLLVKRYGKPVKKRIFALGERFREIDEFLEGTARAWMKRNVRTVPEKAETASDGASALPRKRYARLPAVVRKKVVQLICFERAGVAPNERLLESMDRLIVTGGPSARLNVGKGVILLRRYEEAVFRQTSAVWPPVERGGEEGRFRMSDPGRDEAPAVREGRGTRDTKRVVSSAHPVLIREERRKLPPTRLRKLAEGERAAAFDADGIAEPLSVRPLRVGDRVRPFGLDADKKVKEILVDRKIPRDERWGRPVVCDAKGEILWIPGVVRSAHAPVTGATLRTILLRTVAPADDGPLVRKNLKTGDRSDTVIQGNTEGGGRWGRAKE